MLQELALQLSLPPELSRGGTSFEVGGWWSCVFWTLLGLLCITQFPQVMGLGDLWGLLEMLLVLGFGVVHQYHGVLRCPGCWRGLQRDHVRAHVLCLVVQNHQANLCMGCDHYLNIAEQEKKKKAHLFYKEAV